jgi:predicted AAA+ superfamily ATPase
MEHKFFIKREIVSERIRNGIAHSTITTLLGPRQCGKTYLAKPLATRPENFFDLHSFLDQARLEDGNFRILDGLEGIVVIDEAQDKPELFRKLRVLADRPESTTKFLITGSASPTIANVASESLAGRNRPLSLGGFNLEEVGSTKWEKLWLRGGFPRSYLHELEPESLTWRLDYIDQFLRLDLPALAETKLSAEQLRRLFLLLAHNHGQAWNNSKVAQLIGANYKTVQRYLELFKGAYIVRELYPYFNNLQKRLRKAPKIYLRDSGLLHALFLIRDQSALLSHPSMGFSWEGFGIEQIISLTNSRDEECFTWSVTSGPEVDLILTKSKGVFGFEFKAGDAPKRTKSMAVGVEDLGLTKLFVIYPGKLNYPLDDKIEAVGIENLSTIVVQVA